MKFICTFLIFGTTYCFLSCAPKKKIINTPTTEGPKIAAPIAPQGNLVPFTRDVFFKLRDAGIDVKSLKFFAEKAITLSKSNNSENLSVDPISGVLTVKKGQGENTISILPTTAGLIEAVEADGVKVNFGRSGSTLKFANNQQSPKFFTFLPDKVDKTTNTNEVNYNGSTYKVTTEGGNGLSEIKLMYKQLDIELNTGKGTVEPGIGGKTTLF